MRANSLMTVAKLKNTKSGEISAKEMKETLANSLYESRVTYKYSRKEESGLGSIVQTEDPLQGYYNDMGANDNCKTKFLSFSIVRSWGSLSSSKCKMWDDKELDTLEGVKFFSYFLGQLCITAQFLMCTQTINPWVI